MQQVNSEDTQVPGIPPNIFVCDIPADTFNHCADAIDFLSDAIPALDHGLSEKMVHGIAWILDGISDAIRYESERLQLVKQGTDMNQTNSGRTRALAA